MNTGLSVSAVVEHLDSLCSLFCLEDLGLVDLIF